MRPGCAADHSPPSSAAVMEEQSHTSIHPLGHTGPVMGTSTFTFFTCTGYCSLPEDRPSGSKHVHVEDIVKN